MNNQDINWFGQPNKKGNSKSKSKIKPKANSFSFLGLGPKKAPQKVNYFGFGQNNQYKMKPSALFRKESTKKKKLSKFGDADMDGSLNCFDCDPRNPFKDKLDNPDPNTIAYMQTTTTANQPDRKITTDMTPTIRNKPEVQAAQQLINDVSSENVMMKTNESKTLKDTEQLMQARERKRFLGKTKGRIGEVRTDIREKGVRGALRIYSGREMREKPYEKKMKVNEERVERLKGLLSQTQPGTAEYETLKSDLGKRETEQATYKETTGKIRASAEERLELLKTPRLAGKLALANYEVEEAYAAGKKPTKKQLAALAKYEQQASFKQKLKTVAEKVPGAATVSNS
jgi:hypothetical protein